MKDRIRYFNEHCKNYEQAHIESMRLDKKLKKATKSRLFLESEASKLENLTDVSKEKISNSFLKKYTVGKLSISLPKFTPEFFDKLEQLKVQEHEIKSALDFSDGRIRSEEKFLNELMGNLFHYQLLIPVSTDFPGVLRFLAHFYCTEFFLNTKRVLDLENSVLNDDFKNAYINHDISLMKEIYKIISNY